MSSPPTLADIRKTALRYARGTAPGTDRINIELCKFQSRRHQRSKQRKTIERYTYAIYAIFPLQKLEDCMEHLQIYQAGFQKARSTYDHMFTTRRILEEKWKEGKVVYLVAVDLKQACDTMKHSQIAYVLFYKGVLKYLINQRVKATLHEDTLIQWFGQTTKFVQRNKGGCPLSQRLFTIVQNYKKSSI